MANRYRGNSKRGKSRARNSGGSLTGVFILLGVVIGILLTSAGYMFLSKQSSTNKASVNPHLVKNNEKSVKKEKETAQRFEFYTLLPGMEVQLPDAPANTTNTKNPHAHNAAKKQEPVNVLVQPVSSKPIPLPKAVIRETAVIKETPLTKEKEVQVKGNANKEMAIKESAAKEVQKQGIETELKNAQYILQAGIFQELNLADELKAKLTLQGFNTHIQKVQTQEGQTWFRVTLGPYTSETNALQQKKRLEDQKIRGILILQRPNT